MIREDKYHQALEALRLVLVRARFLAYHGENRDAADLLDSAELLPEYLADDTDRTGEFEEMLSGLAEIDSGCAPALETFQRTATTR